MALTIGMTMPSAQLCKPQHNDETFTTMFSAVYYNDDYDRHDTMMTITTRAGSGLEREALDRWRCGPAEGALFLVED